MKHIKLAATSPTLSHGIETFDPGAASAALQRNVSNRRLSKRTMLQYADAMRRSKWLLNGEAIIFDDDGNLVNGQHRLHAVIISGVPLQTLVVRGVDPATFLTMDAGKKRSVADVLDIEGEKHRVTLAAALRAYAFLIGDGKSANEILTASDAMDVLAEHPEIRFWADQFRTNDAYHLFTSGLVAVLALAAKRHGDDVCMRFLEQVSSGIGLDKESPALALRNKFIEQARAHRFTQQYTLALYIKAINAFIEKRPMKLLRFSSDEYFPAFV